MQTMLTISLAFLDQMEKRLPYLQRQIEGWNPEKDRAIKLDVSCAIWNLEIDGTITHLSLSVDVPRLDFGKRYAMSPSPPACRLLPPMLVMHYEPRSTAVAAAFKRLYDSEVKQIAIPLDDFTLDAMVRSIEATVSFIKSCSSSPV